MECHCRAYQKGTENERLVVGIKFSLSYIHVGGWGVSPTGKSLRVVPCLRERGLVLEGDFSSNVRACVSILTVAPGNLPFCL